MRIGVYWIAEGMGRRTFFLWIWIVALGLAIQLQSPSLSRADSGVAEKQVGIRVAAHRGTTKFAPENTIPAFERAIEMGAHLIEIDVRETRDGELVIMHDASVDRTTNGKGLVSQMTLAEIKRLDAGSWFDKKFVGVRVPSFREALQVMKGRALPDVDFKAGRAEKIRDMLLEEGFLDETPISIYHWQWSQIAKVRELHPNFYIRPDVPIGWVGLPILMDWLNPPIVNIRFDRYSQRLVKGIHQGRALAWVNLLWGKDLMNRLNQTVADGVDVIQTDDLDVVVPYLKARGLYWQGSKANLGRQEGQPK